MKHSNVSMLSREYLFDASIMKGFFVEDDKKHKKKILHCAFEAYENEDNSISFIKHEPVPALVLKLAIDFLNERRKEDGKPEYEISRSIERARDISKYTE